MRLDQGDCKAKQIPAPTWPVPKDYIEQKGVGRGSHSTSMWMPAGMVNHVLVPVRTATCSRNQNEVEAGEGVLIYVRINLSSHESLSGCSKPPPSSVQGPAFPAAVLSWDNLSTTLQGQKTNNSKIYKHTQHMFLCRVLCQMPVILVVCCQA